MNKSKEKYKEKAKEIIKVTIPNPTLIFIYEQKIKWAKLSKQKEKEVNNE